eukprot:CAMPEP_0119087782 /NCGR_PEP_ID=MMETSP1178-20130426/143027_1 /TAXON_ID=33656 /ORGANISM="unid sp, Strain CCMP2000" /LENGTH=76 /DNA_ID=CAMNT_0007071017 /DNA_START=147 /DNA_END=374 /DNA_ORIENTATION=-
MAGGVVSLQRLPAALEQYGLGQLGGATLLVLGHRLMTERKGERICPGMLDCTEEGVEAKRHESKIVPVITVMDVVV